MVFSILTGHRKVRFGQKIVGSARTRSEPASPRYFQKFHFVFPAVLQTKQFAKIQIKKG